jgi:hypothetical protein
VDLVVGLAVGSKADLIPDRLRPCEPHLKCLLSGAEERTTGCIHTRRANYAWLVLGCVEAMLVEI